MENKNLITFLATLNVILGLAVLHFHFQSVENLSKANSYDKLQEENELKKEQISNLTEDLENSKAAACAYKELSDSNYQTIVSYRTKYYESENVNVSAYLSSFEDENWSLGKNGTWINHDSKYKNPTYNSFNIDMTEKMPHNQVDLGC